MKFPCRIEYVRDTKLFNSGTFKLEREDHSMGNLLRMQLLRDPDVVFVGYKHPHPIEHHILLRVQTALRPRNGGNYQPPDALRTALQDLAAEVSTISEQLRSQT